MFSFLNRKNSKKAQESPIPPVEVEYDSLRPKSKKKSKENENDKANRKNNSYFSPGYFTTGRLSKKKPSDSSGLIPIFYFNFIEKC